VHNFTFEEVRRTGNLQVHWATRVGGGDRRGQIDALEWNLGKKSTRTCLGILHCDNPVCEIVIRPHVKPTNLSHQLQMKCKCGAALSIQSCGLRSVLRTWSGGVHYTNDGYHTHQRPTHILHILPNEKARFEAIVKANPTSGPLQLLVGVPTIYGPGESVADISPVFLNAHRVGKERQKIKKEGNLTADGMIAAFKEFAKKHPNFVRRSTIGEDTVISVQTSFMQSQLVKDEELGSEKRPWHCTHVRASHFTHLHAFARTCTHLHAPSRT